MLSRSEAAGITVAVAAHVLLFGFLSLQYLYPPAPKPDPQPIEVSLTDDVGIQSAAPEINHEPPKTQIAPEQGPVEPEEPVPAEPSEPEPVRKPEPKPEPKPLPDPKAKPPEKTQKPATRSNSAQPAKPAPPRKSTGLLGDEFEKGLTETRTPGKSDKPQASMTGQAKQNIGSAIVRQVQPCADRQVFPGPGAEKIRATVSLSLNRDGSLASPVTITGHDGVDDSNERYVRRVDDAVRAIFAGCSPLRGLPAELYDVPGGWRSFKLNYRLKP